ncbi:MAG: NUDIX hydrolase [Nitrospiraceae bacterium]|nr:NUDIX hydrolase [Nitrospiraceae bacterium]
MTRPVSLQAQVSSGGVISRNTSGISEIALIAVKGGNIWCLPKGIIEKNESQEKAAVREVQEETGLKGKVIEKIGEISYWYFIKDKNIRTRKTVHFFLMSYVDGKTEDHNWEVDSAEWFAIDQALEKVSYKGDKEIIEKAKKMLEDINSKNK